MVMAAGVNRYKEDGIPAVLYDRQGLTLLPGGVSIPGGARAVRAGDFVARVATPANNPRSDAGKYIVTKYTQVRTALNNGVLLEVDDAHPFEVGDACTVNADARTINAIDYSTNTLTLSANTTAAVNDDVSVGDNDRNEAIGVALLPSVDKDAVRLGGGAALLTPREGDVLQGAIAITGRFYISKLRNFSASSGHNTYDSYGGGRSTLLRGIGDGQGIFIITNPSSHAVI